MTVLMPTIGQIKLHEREDVFTDMLIVAASYEPTARGAGPVFRTEVRQVRARWLATEFFRVHGRMVAEAIDDLRAQVAAYRAVTLPIPNEPFLMESQDGNF